MPSLRGYADDRRPIPSDDEVATAETMMQELFGESISSAKDDESKGQLAQRLFDAARQSESAPKDHFVLLRAAQRLAVGSGDCTLAVEIAGYFTDRYESDPILVTGKVLRQLSEESLDQSQREELAEVAEAQMKVAFKKKRFVESLAFGRIAQVAARRSRDFRLANRLGSEMKALDELVEGQKKYEAALESLLEDPEDARANLICGRYECFVLGDWLSGLAHLKASQDEAFTTIAEMEYNPDDSPEHKIALGDLWWKQAAVEDTGRDACKLRAAAWYKAAGIAKGLVKVKINQRLSEVATLNQPLPEIKGVQPTKAASDIASADSSPGMVPAVSNDSIQPLVSPKGRNTPSTEIGPVRSGELMLSLREGYGTKMVSLAFSPDSSYLVGVGGSTLTVWDPETGRPLQNWTRPDDTLASVRFSQDGSKMAVVGEGSITVFDCGTGQSTTATIEKEWIKAVSFSPNSTHLALGGDTGEWLVWDWRRQQPIKKWSVSSAFLFETEFLPGGQQVVVAGAGGTIHIVDAATGREVRELAGHTDRVWSLAIFPDGNTAVSGAADRSVVIWSLSTGAPRHVLRGHSDWVRAVDVSADGMTVASGSYDRTVRLWHPRIGRQVAVLAGHKERIEGVAFSPNGKWLASCDRAGMVHVWRLRR